MIRQALEFAFRVLEPPGDISISIGLFAIVLGKLLVDPFQAAPRADQHPVAFAIAQDLDERRYQRDSASPKDLLPIDRADSSHQGVNDHRHAQRKWNPERQDGRQRDQLLAVELSYLSIELFSVRAQLSDVVT